MILGIGLAAILTGNKIFKNVRVNYKLTGGLNKRDRRTLLWRYGPFKMDPYTVEQIKRK